MDYPLDDLPDYLDKALGKWVSAKISDSWKGNCDPESWPEIDYNLRITAKELAEALNKFRDEAISDHVSAALA